MPVGKQLGSAATYYNVLDIKFERQAPPDFPFGCTRVTQMLNPCTRNPIKFHQTFPRSMLQVGFNAPLECYQHIVGDARPPLAGRAGQGLSRSISRLGATRRTAHQRKSPFGKHGVRFRSCFVSQ